MRTVFAAVALLAVSVAATFAADPPVQSQSSEPAVDELLRQSGDTSGVWEADPNNRAHHIQSGLVCDPAFVSLKLAKDPHDARIVKIPLQSVAIVAGDRPRGDDVACNYGSSTGPLLVIEAIHVKPGEDAADVFEDMRKLLSSKYDRFHHTNMPLPLSAEAPGELAKDLKFQHFDATLGGTKYPATIWVGVVRHWAVVVYAVGISDNIFVQHGAVNAQWLSAARWILATSISRGEPAP